MEAPDKLGAHLTELLDYGFRGFKVGWGPFGRQNDAAYDEAIAAAGKAGFRQDAALGNELAACHFIRQNDQDWASFYMTRAYQLYIEWGAISKVRKCS